MMWAGSTARAAVRLSNGDMMWYAVGPLPMATRHLAAVFQVSSGAAASSGWSSVGKGRSGLRARASTTAPWRTRARAWPVA